MCRRKQLIAPNTESMIVGKFDNFFSFPKFDNYSNHRNTCFIIVIVFSVNNENQITIASHM